MSVAGGLWKVFENASSIGANCAQIFGSSPRQWKSSVPSREAVEAYKTARQEYVVNPVYLHAAYLVNLGSSDPAIYEKSIMSLIDHLRIADMIEAKGLIFHLGSFQGGNKEGVLQKTLKGIMSVLEEVQGDTMLIMENAASKKKIGAMPEELGWLLRGANSDRVGVCIDTAHAFEAGTIASFSPDMVREWVALWDREVGWEHIPVLHINDSKTAYNSQHDRHENIGEGYIGKEGFSNLAKVKALQKKDWILEVPGFTGKGPDKQNMDCIKNCIA